MSLFKRLKKICFFILVSAIVSSMICGCTKYFVVNIAIQSDYSLPFAVHGNQFFCSIGDGEYKPFFVKGVNIGPTLPNSSLDNLNIPYEVYADWFSDISAMNANAIRVFTVMNPDFYNALYDYNLQNENNPLYLLQGILANEEDMATFEHAFDKGGDMLGRFENSVKEAVDVIHGNHVQENMGQIYDKDVSSNVIGFVMGLEWDPFFVVRTNEQNPDKKSFTGTFLHTSESSASFEAFLCRVGEAAIEHETLKYGSQRPIAFLNWAVTDTLVHSDDPFPADDLVGVNTENILAQDTFDAGLFAAIDVYPYYPEFMNYQRSYIESADGEINSFRAYLEDLKPQYSVPVIIAEFGLSTSRGRAHESVMGYHQGMLDEYQQGEYLLSMIRDINSLGLAGGFIFCWQDEWFKRTWNVYNAETETARYLNVQSAEQRYGIAAYEPGTNGMICLPDGDLSDWQGIEPVFEQSDLSVSVMQDEAYLYLLLRGYSKENSSVIALGTTNGRGNTESLEHCLSFDFPVDFLIEINGAENTRIKVAANSDLFYYNNAYVWKNIPRNPTLEKPDNGVFNPVMLLTSNPFTLPYETAPRPYAAYETGLLRHGNANPDAKEFDSLADFYIMGDSVEIRLPWNMLNIFDPASRLAADDFYKEGSISLIHLERIYVGASLTGSPGATVRMQPFDLRGYDEPTFHKRLKKSFDILKDGLDRL